MLGLALSGLGWRPADFWQGTPQELVAALDFLADTRRALDGDTVAALKRGLQEGTWNSIS